MKLVSFEALTGSPDTSEWHAWRRGGIGGSDAVLLASGAGLIEAPAWAKPETLLPQKLGLYETPINDAMRRGRDNEADVRAEVCWRLGSEFLPVFGEMSEWPIARASFDGLSFMDDLILEIKCPNKEVHGLAHKGVVADYYMPQLAHQAMVVKGHPDGWTSGLAGYFVSAIPEEGDIAIVPVKLDDLKPIAQNLLLEEQRFWDRVVEGVENGFADRVMQIARSDAMRAVAEAATRSKRREAARKFLIEHIKAGGKSRYRLETRTQKRVDYSGIDLPPGYHRYTWVVSFGRSAPKIDTPDEAEEILSKEGDKDDIDDATIKAALIEAAETVGPLRIEGLFSVYRRSVPEYKRYCEDCGITPPRKEVAVSILKEE